MYNEWQEKYNEKSEEYENEKRKRRDAEGKLEDAKEEKERLERRLAKANERLEEAEEKLTFNKDLPIVGSQEMKDLEEKLAKTKEELEKLRNAPSKSTGISGDVLELKEKEIEKLKQELVKWTVLFPDQDPKKLKEFAEEALNHQKTLEELNGKLEEAKKGNSTEDINKLAAELRVAGEKYVEIGGKAGGFLLGPLGSLIGAGLATTEGFTMAGLDVYEKTRRGAQEFATDTMHVGADAFENVRQGAENVTGKAMDNAKELLGKGIGIFDVMGAGSKIADSLGSSIGDTEKAKAERDVKIAEASAKARTEEIESLKKQLEEKKEEIKKLEEKKESQIKEAKAEKEKQIEKLEAQIEKKEAQIEKLETKIENLEKKLEESQKQLIAQIEVKK